MPPSPDSTVNNYLVLYFQDTPSGLLKTGRKYTYTHTQAPTFMLAGFMSWSVKAINKSMFPAVCLPVQALKKEN